MTHRPSLLFFIIIDSATVRIESMQSSLSCNRVLPFASSRIDPLSASITFSYLFLSLSLDIENWAIPSRGAS